MSTSSQPAVPASGTTSTPTGRRRGPGVVGWVGLVLGALYVALLWFAWWNESAARQDPGMDGTVTGSWLEQWAVLTHLLPAVVLLVAVVLSWRWPLVGAVAFGGYALMTVFMWFPEWIYAPVVTLPPMIVGALFLIDALLSRRAARSAPSG